MTAAPPAQSSPAQSAAGALARTLRRWQFWLLLAAAGVMTAAAVQFFGTQDQERYGLESTELEGYGALARVLEDQGVEVHLSRSAEETLELMEQHPDAALTVFEVGPPTAPGAVEEITAAERETIWLAPGAETLDGLFGHRAPTLLPAPTQGIFGSPQEIPADADPEAPSCQAEAAPAAESIRTRGQLFAGDLIADEATDACFTVSVEQSQAPLDEEDGGAPAAALLETQHGTLFGSPAAFTNQHITTEGHAALALRLFGTDEDLIWYTPTGAELSPGDQDQWASPWDYMPDWVVPVSWWLLVCTGVLILVQGRRHGPVVAEPLPVEVPASESAEGRGRLYQNANATRESARTLRSAHLLRAARLLRLGPLPSEQTVIEAIARQSGQPAGQLAQELDSRDISSNAALVQFAQRLLAQENELRVRLGFASRDHRTPQERTSESTAETHGGNQGWRPMMRKSDEEEHR